MDAVGTTTPDGAPAVRFLVHGAERSGPPIYVLRLLRAWSGERPAFRPQVVLARPGPLRAELERLVPTRVARLDRRSPDRRLQRAVTRVAGTAAGDAVMAACVRARVRGAEAPAVTVVNGATQPTVDLLRATRPSGDVVMIAHELSTGWLHNVDEAGRRLLRSRVRRYLAVSHAVADFLTGELGVDPAEITVVPPPVELVGRADRARDGRFVVAGGGMTDWRKAPELWLRVAASLLERRPDGGMEFVWFGGSRLDDPAAWPLLHEVRRLGLQDHVRFVGEVGNPAELLRTVDVFVSTAREDAYPLVCAESAAAGVPVVTFDSGGAAELVTEAGCGVVGRYPDEGSLVDAVLDLHADDERRARLGEHGAAFAARALDARIVAKQVAEWLS